jgi:hypothetical protein
MFASWSETDFIDAVASCPTLADAQAKLERSPKSECVEGFGCRPIAAMRLAPWPASESLQ